MSGNETMTVSPVPMVHLTKRKERRKKATRTTILIVSILRFPGRGAKPIWSENWNHTSESTCWWNRTTIRTTQWRSEWAFPDWLTRWYGGTGVIASSTGFYIMARAPTPTVPAARHRSRTAGRRGGPQQSQTKDVLASSGGCAFFSMRISTSSSIRTPTWSNRWSNWWNIFVGGRRRILPDMRGLSFG